MIRGTTAQFKFKLPYSYGDIQSILIRFWQNGNPSEELPIIKNKTNCSEPVAKEIVVSLRPSETAMFSDRYKASVQLRATPYIGAPFGSKERLVPVYPMPDDIIVDDPAVDPIPPATEEWIILDGEEIV